MIDRDPTALDNTNSIGKEIENTKESLIFISHAQNFEDVMLWRALKTINNGFYIDVGAFSPVTDSITAAFYERGWHGINIEPVLELFENFVKCRPLDLNMRICAGSTTAESVFYTIPTTGLSTLNAEIATDHRQKGFDVREELIQILPLAEICKRHVSGPIHFLKVDAEGSEHAVLAGADWATFRPWIVLVEATAPLSQQPTFEQWEYLLTQNKYQWVWFDGLNRFYVAAEHQGLIQFFQTPPNIFDGFKLNRSHNLVLPPENE